MAKRTKLLWTITLLVCLQVNTVSVVKTENESQFLSYTHSGRRTARSLRQNPIIDLIMKSVAPNYEPQNPGDLFDFLRDQYPLPNENAWDDFEQVVEEKSSTENAADEGVPLSGTAVLEDSGATMLRDRARAVLDARTGCAADRRRLDGVYSVFLLEALDRDGRCSRVYRVVRPYIHYLTLSLLMCGLKTPLSEYDYIIVGAGSSGCVLAARLTEDPNVTVLLLEAGKAEMITTDIPAIAPFFQRTDYTWPYYMEPQSGVCLGMINGRCFWPRGKAIGGTSVINYMIYTRGRPQEWDRIAAAGNYGWSYQEVLQYYMKSERSSLRGLENSPYRGRAGEMNTEFVSFRTPLIEAFLEAGRLLGHPTTDYNSPEELGFGYVQTNTQNGKRVSTAKAFLHPNKNRQNLHILPISRVTKVLIDKNTKTAVGVQYVRNRLKYNVRVRREVILSAGPIASPHLLMLSGIGPKEQLSRHGIPLIHDLPVGRTLYDHITFPAVIFTINRTGISFNENRQNTFNNVLQWIQYGDSAPSSPGAVEGIGYIRTPLSDDPDPVPDIELISIGGSLVSDGGPGASMAARRGMMLADEIFNSAFGEIDNTDTWSAFPMLLHPKSVGFLELRNNNPFSYPRLHGNYLTDPRDVATFVAGIRYIQALAATEPFQRLGARLHRAQYPTCRNLVFDSDEYWECAVRTFTATLHHQIATCRMGPVGDPQAVVDPELRVHGIKRLRVVDSGVIPRTVSVHTNAPAIMIGEKAADMIKATLS